MYEIFELLLKSHNITAYKVSKETGITQSTLSDWKRGRSTPKTDNMKKIADYFGVSIEYLMTGKDESNADNSPIKKESKDIKKILADAELLLRQDGLMFDGELADEQTINAVLSAMEIGMEMAKKRNKEKYTPNKYKKDK